MNYTEYKQSIINKNIRLILDMCRWVKTENKNVNVHKYFYIQPCTDAHEVIVRLLIEQMAVDVCSIYKCTSINPYALLIIYDTEEQIQRCDARFYTSTRYEQGRMVLVVSIDMIGYEHDDT